LNTKAPRPGGRSAERDREHNWFRAARPPHLPRHPPHAAAMCARKPAHHPFPTPIPGKRRQKHSSARLAAAKTFRL
jgi:hypothetical protein